MRCYRSVQQYSSTASTIRLLRRPRVVQLLGSLGAKVPNRSWTGEGQQREKGVHNFSCQTFQRTTYLRVSNPCVGRERTRVSSCWNFYQTQQTRFSSSSAAGDGRTTGVESAGNDVTTTVSQPDVSSLSWYDLSPYVMDAVHWTHDLTGIGYAGCIALCTVGMRLALLPLAVRAGDAKNRRDWVELEMKQFRYKRPHASKEQAKMHWGHLRTKHGYRSSRLYAEPIASISTMLICFYGMRNLALFYPDDLATGGYLWFQNLHDPDPLRYLPILSTTLFWFLGEAGADYTGRAVDMKPFWANFSRAFRVVIFFAILDAPCTIFCYFIPNGLCLIGQTVLLSRPDVQQSVGMTRPPGAPFMNKGIGSETQTQQIVYYDDLKKNRTATEKSVNLEVRSRGPKRIKSNKKGGKHNKRGRRN